MERITLATGVELDVEIAGDPTAPAIILLHGFPESHRTWRHQVPEFARDHYVVAPDQRGYARSSKPKGVENYKVECIIGDLIALADYLGIDRFTLVGHDWGGAIAWGAALGRPDRIERLVILNAPHPYLFQKSLYEDREQRRASQYVNRFRDTSIDQGLTGSGLEHFFGSAFAQYLTRMIGGGDKAAYLDEWSQAGAMTAMLNWYRASGFQVPGPDDDHAPRPALLDFPFPSVRQPTLVIWGMGDKALLPVQIEGLDALVDDLTIVRLPDVGHFVPWEAPDAVNRALREWLAVRE